MTIPKLSDGATYGYDGNGQRVCTGSRMGRRNAIPDDADTAGKLHLRRLAWQDGDYDRGGAYWGNSRDGSAIYRATGYSDTEQIEIFVRAKSRNEAKKLVREEMETAKFFR